MSTPTSADKLLSTLGLCARARKLVMGTPMVCEALRAGGKHPPLAVFEASDTSENTHKKLRSKCAYYHTPLYRLPADTSALAHAVGKSGAVAAVALTDQNLFKALAPHLPAPEETSPSEADPSVNAPSVNDPSVNDPSVNAPSVNAPCGAEQAPTNE